MPGHKRNWDYGVGVLCIVWWQWRSTELHNAEASKQIMLIFHGQFLIHWAVKEDGDQNIIFITSNSQDSMMNKTRIACKSYWWMWLTQVRLVVCRIWWALGYLPASSWLRGTKNHTELTIPGYFFSIKSKNRE